MYALANHPHGVLGLRDILCGCSQVSRARCQGLKPRDVEEKREQRARLRTSLSALSGDSPYVMASTMRAAQLAKSVRVECITGLGSQ